MMMCGVEGHLAPALCPSGGKAPSVLTEVSSVQLDRSRVARTGARVPEKACQTSLGSARSGNQPSDDVVGLYT